MKSKYLDYRDCNVSVFHDDEKCLMLFVNDLGQSKAICYDSNFFYVEELLDAYFEAIEQSFKGWKNKELSDDDYDEIKGYLRKYYKHLKRQCDDIDLSQANENVRRLLKARTER